MTSKSNTIEDHTATGFEGGLRVTGVSIAPPYTVKDDDHETHPAKQLDLAGPRPGDIVVGHSFRS
jgi:hypothetical protein